MLPPDSGSVATLESPPNPPAPYEQELAPGDVSQSTSRTVRVALPAFNEEEAIEPLITSLHETLSEIGAQYEIVVVDDGSTDDTAAIVSRLSFSLPVRLVAHKVNQGLAGALRTGLSDAVAHSSPGDIVITLDADNTQPPGLIPRMLGMVREGHDVVIASRFQPGARVVGVPFDRVLLSIAARFMFRLAFPITGVRDYTCGFRAYRTEALAATMAQYGENFVSEKGFSCMVDVLLKMRKTKLGGSKIVMGEAPMILRYDQKGGASKMQVLRTIGQTLSLIVRRWFGG